MGLVREAKDQVEESLVARLLNLLQRKKHCPDSEAGLRIAKLIERGSFIRCK